MKVACIQLSSGENYIKNVKQIIYFVKQAIKNKADLIITPETSSIITSNKKILFQNTYEMQNYPLIKKIRDISKKNNQWILLGSLPIKDGRKIRYLHVDTPEISRSENKESDCFGDEAKKLNTELVLNKTVDLEYDLNCYDMFSRTLAFLSIDVE